MVSNFYDLCIQIYEKLNIYLKFIIKYANAQLLHIRISCTSKTFVCFVFDFYIKCNLYFLIL